MNQTKQATILVVDDDEASRKLLEALLAAEGHAVRTADSDAKALAAVAAQLPDLILLDIMMPGIDGFEVTRRLKADSRSRHIPIMLVTSLDEAKETQEATAQHIQKIMTQGNDRFETRQRRKDGQLLDIELSVVYRPGKGDGHLFAFMRDITERKRAEIQLNEQLNELRRWHEATLGREMRTLELKREINELLKQAGQPPRYHSVEASAEG